MISFRDEVNHQGGQLLCKQLSQLEVEERGFAQAHTKRCKGTLQLNKDKLSI